MELRGNGCLTNQPSPRNLIPTAPKQVAFLYLFYITTDHNRAKCNTRRIYELYEIMTRIIYHYSANNMQFTVYI